MSKADLSSLFMALSLTGNLIVGFFDPVEIVIPKEAGLAMFICGSLFFVYVLFYLRSGFLGETEPRLDFLITDGPYGFCRHPLYLSFIVMVFGLDVAFRSVMGIVFTLALSIPSVIYRAKREDELLRNRFGEDWNNYADRVGFLLPKSMKRSVRLK